ncbi:hypothetical protein LT679_12460 [Mucilaginibacter roseus]|uniref:Leucine-rich repeat domain-containing protein n=1 Tax=Mucilaginibacter roseus TaxID=1528868 RepID=A0ABS8U5S4_9SPHI|nr:hypothetical protein [Mucilaginibacter roseus]MCD8741420.1 hypothetical protein [Mucilaginibacter roseus]
MKKYLILLSIVLSINFSKIKAMNFQDTVSYYTYDQFKELALNDSTLKFIPANVKTLHIQNENFVFHPPWSVEQDLPDGGLYFEFLKNISDLERLEEIRLIKLFVKDLPQSFKKLTKLKRLGICLSKTADIEQILETLEKMPSLKYLDIYGSRLLIEQQKYIIKRLSKSGITVDDSLIIGG